MLSSDSSRSSILVPLLAIQLAVVPAPRLLTPDVHRDGQQCDGHRDAANDEEAVANALHRNPVVYVESQSEGEHVLDKVHDSKGLAGLLPVAIRHVRYDR